jgi:hypothetical protein
MEQEEDEIGRSEVEEGPDMWVPHVNGLREGKIKATRVISRHHSSMARGHGLPYQQKGQMC